MDSGKVSALLVLRLLLLTEKQIAELDTPEQLLANQDSIFYSLVHEAGLTSTKTD
jgi:ABC-type multidrug transport system fused ATPase/permease subunit